ncbi:hypothetical protein [Microbispora sp. NBC_01389]|uniref:hypothetical protein n=1 Tax=Microbispora sp. NBC_01389 TaxID=2903584 RepID=UPI00324EBBDB
MSMRITAPSAVRSLALAVLASTAVAGCGAGGNATPQTSTAAHKQPAPEASAAKVVANPLPTKVANEPSVRENVVQTKCASVPGGWGAEGTAKNLGKKAVTYKIVVYFTTKKATTLDFAQARVTVPPGKTVPWKASKHFHADGEMLCPMPGISVET